MKKNKNFSLLVFLRIRGKKNKLSPWKLWHSKISKKSYWSTDRCAAPWWSMTDALASFTGYFEHSRMWVFTAWGPPLLGAGLLQLQRVGPLPLQCEAPPCSGSSLRSGSTDSITRPSAAVACAPSSGGSGTVVQGLRCSMACGISPAEGLNLCLLH